MSSSLWYYLFPWRPLLRLLGVVPRADGDYEQVLQSLTEKIEQVQSRLAQVRQRERRARVTLPFFAMSIWLIYTCIVFFLGRLDTQDIGEAVLWPLLLVLGQGVGVGGSTAYWLPTLLIPLAVACSRRPVQWWYGRVHAAEEKHLAALIRKRRGKIDEIKRVTKYDHLRLLLDRYDDTRPSKPGPKPKPKPGAPAEQATAGTIDPATAQKRAGGRQSMPAMGPAPAPNNSLAPPLPAMPSQYQRGQSLRPSSSHQSLRSGRSVSTPWAPAGPSTAPLTAGASMPPVPAPTEGEADMSATMNRPGQGLPSALQGPQPHTPPQPLPPPQRTLLDKLADAILGPDPTQRAPGPEQRYALICRSCHHHNGLAWKEDWEEIQYICPHCGARNSNRPSTVPVTWPSMPLTPKKSARKLPPSPSVKSIRLGPAERDDTADVPEHKLGSSPSPRRGTPSSDEATPVSPRPEVASVASVASEPPTAATTSSLKEPAASIRHRTHSSSSEKTQDGPEDTAPDPAEVTR